MARAGKVFSGRARLPQVFGALPESAEKPPNIIRRRPLHVKATGLYGDGNVEMRPDSQPAITTSDTNRSLQCSATEWIEPNLGIKRLTPENKGEMYVQNTLKRRKQGKSPLETGAQSRAKDISEEDIVDETEPVSYSIPSEEKSTAIGKLVKAMAPLCFIYDVAFRTGGGAQAWRQ